MELSMNITNLLTRCGLEKSVELYKNAGFTAIDYSLGEMSKVEDSPLNGDGYRDEAERVRKLVESGGLIINQTHTPFHFKHWYDEEHYKTVIYPRICRSIEISALLGAKIAVVHPLHYLEFHGREEEIFQMNMDFYRSLIPLCREYNIQVGIENMWRHDPRRRYITHDTCSTKEEFVRYIDTLDSEYMVATLDIGHVGLPLQDDEAWDFIRALGHDRLKSLHVHDNDYRTDSHILPFSGKINWNEVTKALGEINYDGDMTYEVGAVTVNNVPEGFLQTAVNYMGDVGRFLISEIERNRQA